MAEALEYGAEFGIWGGMTERGRRTLIKRHPDVTDWAAWLAKNNLEDTTPALRSAHLRAARTMAAR